MILAYHKIIPPKQWQHKSSLQNNYNDTVAMILAEKEIIPPNEWNHKPEL